MIRRWHSKKLSLKSGKNIFFLIFALILGTIFIKGVISFASMKAYRDKLKEENELMKENNAKMEERMTKIYGDQEYIEKVAREQLGLVKDGETVYIITDDKK